MISDSVTSYSTREINTAQGKSTHCRVCSLLYKCCFKCRMLRHIRHLWEYLIWKKLSHETGVVVVVEDACLISKVRANRKPKSASFCKPSPHPTVTACSACCIADTVWSVERGMRSGERREIESMREGEEVFSVCDYLGFMWEREHESVVDRQGGMRGRDWGRVKGEQGEKVKLSLNKKANMNVQKSQRRVKPKLKKAKCTKSLKN